MDSNKKSKDAKPNNKEKEKFNSKKIKHDPNAESARAVFGKNK